MSDCFGFSQTFPCSIEAQKIDTVSFACLRRAYAKRFQIELFHEQLPLPVPCYDLLPVTKLTVGPQNETSGIPGSLELTGGEYKT